MIELALPDEGITVQTGAALTSVRTENRARIAALRSHVGEEVELRASHLLIATGRRPVTAALGLDTVGVKTGIRGEVVVDDYQRTTTMAYGDA
ncbi:FAD-dependent oxidoreductase [Streptomyces sp. NPDC002054]|uniref:FAD-dependent oxidoreductase n=1 Tax=Streptomyces sp. NPDC002054 TaxID=3154663 RepID=UPI00332425DE